MASDNKASGTGRKSGNDTKLRYAHLVVYLKRRASLVTWCIGSGVFLGLVVFPHTAGFVESWITLLPVILAVGAATLAIPPTEEWEYTPWQAEPERYEHYNWD
jgi:hypothetical protein